MASKKQAAANSRNAEKSTGPRSAAGKARSRQNALKHGLTAEQLLLPGEEPAEYEELHQAVFTRLAPEDALEIQLVERVVSLLWRLRRVPAFEVALFEWKKHDQAKDDGGLDDILSGLERRSFLGSSLTDTDSDSSATQEILDVGRTVEALLKMGLTDKLSRCETNLQRQLSATLKELRELQANRPIPVKCIDAAA